MAKIETFIDNFDDNSTDTVKWPNNFNGSGNVMSETGGRVLITLGGTSGQYSAYSNTTNSYDLTASYAMVNPTTFTNDGAANTQSYLKILKDSTNFFVITKIGTNLTLQRQVAGVDSNTSVPFVHAQMAWWRIREESGNILWETSMNGTSWKVQRTLANPLVITAMFAELGAGSFAAGEVPGSAAFDNFNVVQTKPSYQVNSLRPHAFSPGRAR